MNRTYLIALVAVLIILVLTVAITIVGLIFFSGHQSQVTFGFVPTAPTSDAENINAVIYSRHVKEPGRTWAQQLKDHLNRLNTDQEKAADCTYQNGLKSSDSTICKVSMKLVPACSSGNSYGYQQTGGPCVLVQVNSVEGWEPEGFGIITSPNRTKVYSRALLDSDLVTQTSHGMPKDLVEFIKERVLGFESTNAEMELTRFLGSLWITCSAARHEDREIGTIMYSPMPGIPSYHFPYLGQPDYIHPFVMLWLRNPKPGQFFLLSCRPWAKNVYVNYESGEGIGFFGIQVN